MSLLGEVTVATLEHLALTNETQHCAGALEVPGFDKAGKLLLGWSQQTLLDLGTALGTNSTQILTLPRYRVR